MTNANVRREAGILVFPWRGNFHDRRLGDEIGSPPFFVVVGNKQGIGSQARI